MVIDCSTKPAASVAIIGGMPSPRIRTMLATPAAGLANHRRMPDPADQNDFAHTRREPHAQPRREAGPQARVAAVHDPHREVAGERHHRRDRQVDVARSGRDHEHLPDADDGVERGELERAAERLERAPALRDGGGDRPDDHRPGDRPKPGLPCGPAPHPPPHQASPLRTRARDASTAIRITPCTLSCQSVETLRKDRSEPVSSMMIAPTTAPTGETMPPKNSPPPTITAAIESSVYWPPTLASPVVFRPVSASPASTPRNPAAP